MIHQNLLWARISRHLKHFDCLAPSMCLDTPSPGKPHQALDLMHPSRSRDEVDESFRLKIRLGWLACVIRAKPKAWSPKPSKMA